MTTERVTPSSELINIWRIRQAEFEERAEITEESGLRAVYRRFAIEYARRADELSPN